MIQIDAVASLKIVGIRGFVVRNGRKLFIERGSRLIGQRNARGVLPIDKAFNRHAARRHAMQLRSRDWREINLFACGIAAFAFVRTAQGHIPQESIPYAKDKPWIKTKLNIEGGIR